MGPMLLDDKRTKYVERLRVAKRIFESNLVFPQELP